MKHLLGVVLLMALASVGYATYICNAGIGPDWCVSDSSNNPPSEAQTLDRCCERHQKCQAQCDIAPNWHCVCDKRFCNCLNKITQGTLGQICKNEYFASGNGHNCFRWKKTKPYSCERRKSKVFAC